MRDLRGTPDNISRTVLFPDLFDKPLVATFNREQASSDGGGVLLKAAERVYGLVKAFAGCLADKRAPEKVRHTLAELVGQRIFGIACGHPDGNDADLAEDPIHKLLLGRDPVAGAPLASQPTILAVRERRGSRRALPNGAGVGGERDRAASPPPAPAGVADHHRSGSDRRPDAWRATAHVLQRELVGAPTAAARGRWATRRRNPAAAPPCRASAGRGWRRRFPERWSGASTRSR